MLRYVTKWAFSCCYEDKAFSQSGFIVSKCNFINMLKWYLADVVPHQIPFLKDFLSSAHILTMYMELKKTSNCVKHNNKKNYSSREYSIHYLKNHLVYMSISRFCSFLPPAWTWVQCWAVFLKVSGSSLN